MSVGENKLSSLLTIEVGQARDEKLELFCIKNADEITTDNLMEAAKERIYLLLDIEVHLVESEQFYVLCLVAIVDCDVRSALLERDFLILSEVVTRDCEILTKVSDIVVEVPFQVAITVIIHIR